MEISKVERHRDEDVPGGFASLERYQIVSHRLPILTFFSLFFYDLASSIHYGSRAI